MSIDDEDMKQEEDEYNNYEDDEDEDEDDDTVEELLCDHTTEWMEGRIIIVDYDSMTFLVRTRGAMMHFPFFSARLADIHTYTIPWRNMNTLKIGRKMEVLLDTLDWIPGIIVMRDLLHSTVHIATCQDGRIVVEPFHIESSLRITLFPTYLSDSTNWIKIEWNAFIHHVTLTLSIINNVLIFFYKKKKLYPPYFLYINKKISESFTRRIFMLWSLPQQKVLIFVGRLVFLKGVVVENPWQSSFQGIWLDCLSSFFYTTRLPKHVEEWIFFFNKKIDIVYL